jgi:predicted amidophosphoribosyltransferase
MSNELAAHGSNVCAGCGAQLIGNETRGQRCNRCLESPPKFVAVRVAVMRGAEWIATAASHNMARRIARALNQYQPNERGY